MVVSQLELIILCVNHAGMTQKEQMNNMDKTKIQDFRDELRGYKQEAKDLIYWASAMQSNLEKLEEMFNNIVEEQ